MQEVKKVETKVEEIKNIKMKPAEKVAAFEKELPFIKGKDMREFATKSVEELPDYFFTVPASSSGRFHPSYALGNGGLLRHTRSALRIAHELFRMDMFKYLGQNGRDIVFTSLILHDGQKQGDGKGKHTVATHPLLQAEAMRKSETRKLIPSDDFDIICGNIECHMGQWNFDYTSHKEVLPKPDSRIKNIVHLCDYLASRRCLEMNFEAKLST